jgi:hypothetical protein
MNVNEVARRLKKSRMTVLRMIEDGCPVVEPGSVGRTHGTILNFSDVQQWLVNRAAPGLKQQHERFQLEQLAESLWRVLRSDQAAQAVGISERQLAGILVLTYERIAKDLTHTPVDLRRLPARMKQICSISSE